MYLLKWEYDFLRRGLRIPNDILEYEQLEAWDKYEGEQRYDLTGFEIN